MREAERVTAIETYLVERGASALGISDDELADLIREEPQGDVLDSDSASLDRYLKLVPDLERRVVALDAAIDVVLRRRSHGGPPDARVVEELSGHYPHLAEQIRDAAALNAGLASSRGMFTGPRIERTLPSEFGPVMSDGAPRYLLKKKLGQGAHGEVFLAEDRWLADRESCPEVAIKLLAGGHRNERARQRLMDEAAKARRVNHANVVRVFDRGTSADGEDYIAYEYVAGGTLDAALPERHGKRWIREIVKLIANVARGVHAAHHAGLVHCDLKPGNILIADDGSPKVADFGIAARVVDPEDEVIRGTAGGPLGNLAFISPEQFREEPGSVAIPADLYALGGLLYYALTRELPNGHTPEEIALRHRSGEAGTPVSLRANNTRAFDADLDSICAKALAPVAAQRYSSAAAFADDLEAWARREPVSARRTSVAHRLSLGIRRSPLAASLIAATVISIGLGTVALNRAYLQDRAMNLFRAAIKDMTALQARAEFGSSLLPTVWALEQMNGTSVLGREKFDELVFEQRDMLLTKELERARATGREHDFKTLLWEVTLGHWMLQETEANDRVRPLLAESARKWRTMLPASDPMLRYVDMLHASAVIREAWFPRSAESSMEPLLPDIREQVAEAAHLIEQYLEGLPDSERYSPGHLIAVRSLGHAYGRKLIGNVRKQDYWNKMYLHVKEGHTRQRDPISPITPAAPAVTK